MGFGCRLSLARRGVRGVGAGEWLLNQGHSLPDAPNKFVASSESGFVMSLSHREFWLLQPGSEASVGRPASGGRGGCLATILPVQSCMAQLAGETRASCAKLCGVDLSEAAFPLGSLAQTQAARVLVSSPPTGSTDYPCFQFCGSIPRALSVGGD